MTRFTEKTAFLTGVATSPTIRAAARLTLFWRTAVLDDAGLGCETAFGIATAAGYNDAGVALFRSIGGNGTN
eukprot:gene11238-642_t